MINFLAFNPVKLHFGKGVVKDLGSSAAALGRKALLVYGGGSVLRNGSYNDTLEQLKSFDIAITEYNGIKPNPRVEDVMDAASLGREAEVDMVIAVGGGSVIDSAKIIAICIAENCDAWEVMTGVYEPASAKPSPIIKIGRNSRRGEKMIPHTTMSYFPKSREKSEKTS